MRLSSRIIALPRSVAGCFQKPPQARCRTALIRPLSQGHSDERHSPPDGRPRRCRPLPCRLGPQGNEYCRNRNAWPHGYPPGIHGHAAAEGRARHRFAAHDHPDRRARRDAASARRRSALGFLQHLLHAGPCGCRPRGCWHPGVRLQGRNAGGLLGLHAPHLRVRRQGHRGRRPEHDSRRRRRRHAAHASWQEGREGPERSGQPAERRRDLPVRLHQGEARG